MSLESYNLKIVLILTVGFSFASLLGYISYRLKLSPILGYLLAGFIIGPYSPGFVADVEVSEQLAEIGIILMMFGVGLHFKWQHLVNVKNIAVPGAVGQVIVTTTLATLFVAALGWPVEVGIVIGLAISVASTVVLIHVLNSNLLLQTSQGHIAVGWLIVEDILTVIVLLLLPAMADFFKDVHFSYQNVAWTLLLMVAEFTLLVGLMLILGRTIVTHILFRIARTRSSELFTLTVLALTFVIATASAVIFSTSLALGAFIAGMVIGQTEVREQASANALPLKETFAAIFFLSVGMLFNPMILFEQFWLFFGVLVIIIFIKPLAALLIVLLFKRPVKTAVIVAIALAQIGEFSFILAEEAMKLKMLPNEGYDVIVACSLISIAVNPLLFPAANWITDYIEQPLTLAALKSKKSPLHEDTISWAVIVGFGPIGQSAARIVEENGFTPIIIDRNIDTIKDLSTKHREAVYGDAAIPQMLEAAHLEKATLLVITIPETAKAISVVEIARQLNPNIHIVVRARHASEKDLFKEMAVDVICCDEEEAKHAFENALQGRFV